MNRKNVIYLAMSCAIVLILRDLIRNDYNIIAIIRTVTATVGLICMAIELYFEKKKTSKKGR